MPTITVTATDIGVTTGTNIDTNSGWSLRTILYESGWRTTGGGATGYNNANVWDGQYYGFYTPQYPSAVVAPVPVDGLYASGALGSSSGGVSVTDSTGGTVPDDDVPTGSAASRTLQISLPDGWEYFSYSVSITYVVDGYPLPPWPGATPRYKYRTWAVDVRAPWLGLTAQGQAEAQLYDNNGGPYDPASPPIVSGTALLQNIYTTNGHTVTIEQTNDFPKPRLFTGIAWDADLTFTWNWGDGVTVTIEPAHTTKSLQLYNGPIIGTAYNDVRVSYMPNMTLTHTYGTPPNEPATLSAVDSSGLKTRVWSKSFRPEAAFNMTMDGAEATADTGWLTVPEQDKGNSIALDASTSFGRSASIVKYEWFVTPFWDGVLRWSLSELAMLDVLLRTPLKTGETASFTLGDVEAAFVAYLRGVGAPELSIAAQLADMRNLKRYTVILVVTDALGVKHARLKRITITAETSRFGSFVDAATSVLFTAVNDGTGVQVSRFPNGAASRQLLARIEDAKNPSICRQASGIITLGYTKRSNGQFTVVQSGDDGRVFA